MQVKTLILGAGAAGLFTAAHAGPGTLIVDHAKAPGEKIRISGGGRCNFTNLGTRPEAFLSGNPHFVKSALARYGAQDFLGLVEAHGIPWHEKTLGQLFCDTSAKDIIAMLLDMVRAAGAELRLNIEVGDVSHDGSVFHVALAGPSGTQSVTARNLVIATGGKSIPKMGATGRAYDIADQFGLPVTETRAGLVPFTFPDGRFSALAGIATPVRAAAGGQGFDEAMLFTHRGLSGPAILQASSYWAEGTDITIDLFPDQSLRDMLEEAKRQSGAQTLARLLAGPLPARLAQFLAPDLPQGPMAELAGSTLDDVTARLTRWTLRPGGTEGYRTAEVTCGGIDTAALSSKTMEAKAVPGLFFIGECVDVTGWLGGYNFQWAWSSAHAAATEIAMRD